MPIFRKLFDRVIASTYYRKYIYTDPHFQLVAMSLRKGQTIPTETHEVTQSFFVLAGSAILLVGETTITARKGDCVVIPAGTSHSVTAIGRGVKILTVYAPQEHPLPTKDEPKGR